jgi:hypothetical protein
MSSRRLRELAGLPRVALREEMAQATRQNGKWTDGEYTEGESITMHGLGWNIEFEPDPQSLAANRDTGQPVEGAWYAINDQGEEVEFTPGQEDAHFPDKKPVQKFPESEQIDEASETAVMDAFKKIMDFAEKFERTTKKGGFLERQIEGIGGDPSGLNEVRQALEDLYRAAEEADYHARAHITRD